MASDIAALEIKKIETGTEVFEKSEQTQGVSLSHSVNFENAFDHIPAVFVTPVTSVPDKVFATVIDITTTGFKINFVRNMETATTYVIWMAI